MSILKRQELIEFDPTKREHRAAAIAFMKRNAWVDSPLRFAYDPQYGSVAEQVKAKMLDWYVEQEMAKPSWQKRKVTARIKKPRTDTVVQLVAKTK